MERKTQCNDYKTIFTGIGDDTCPECEGVMHEIQHYGTVSLGEGKFKGKTHHTLRERFKEFESTTSVLGDVSDEISDFFLSAFSTSVEEKIKELEALKNKCKECGSTDLEWGYEGGTDCAKCHETVEGLGGVRYNQGIDLAISLMRELLSNYK